MTMVSDLFNNQLKYRVDSLCSDIANELASCQTAPFSGSFQSQSQNGSDSQMQAGGTMASGNSLFVPDPEANWWSPELGVPNAIGSQNQVRYAYFANTHRLAVKTGGDVWVYDTLDHQIGGFSQQQGSGGSITFTSQYGTVNLSTLPVVTRNGVSQPIPSVPQPSASNNQSGMLPNADQNSEFRVAPSADRQSSVASPPDGGNIIETLERLGGLRDKGYVTEEEFALKKAELLSRL
jgi:hypothetical protein